MGAATTGALKGQKSVLCCKCNVIQNSKGGSYSSQHGEGPADGVKDLAETFEVFDCESNRAVMHFIT